MPTSRTMALACFCLLVSTGAAVAQDGVSHTFSGPVDLLWEEYGAVAYPRVVANPARPSSFFFLAVEEPVLLQPFLEVSDRDARTGVKTWVARNRGVPRSIAVDPSGQTVFVLGQVFEQPLWLAYDAVSGALLWSRAGGEGDLSQLVVSPDGSRLYAVGSVGESPNSDFLTVASDAASGEPLWSTRYDGPAAYRDRPLNFTVGPDGSTIFVLGLSYVPVSAGGVRGTLATVAYDARDGSEKWAAVNESGYRAGWQKVQASVDGSFVVASGTRMSAYDSETGELVWDTEGVTDFVLEGNRVIVTDDSSSDFVTRALDVASGAELWARRYDGPLSRGDYPFSLALDPSGGTVAVSGDSEGEYSRRSLATVAYDTATGEELWVARFQDVIGSYYQLGPRILAEFATDGSYLITVGDTLRESVSTFVIAYSVGVTFELALSHPVHPRGGGVLRVALLGSDRFDVSGVDRGSLRLGEGEAEPLGDARDDPRDVNGDGREDLVLRFLTSEIGIDCGDSTLTLTGRLVDGRRIAGTGAVSTVGCAADKSAVSPSSRAARRTSW